MQLNGERMRDYAAYRQSVSAGFPVKDRVRKVATVRFTQFFAHHTVTFNVFAFLGLSEKDRYLIPSLRYAFSDNLWAEVGANLFGGNRGGMFGSLRGNSNVYFTVRYALKPGAVVVMTPGEYDAWYQTARGKMDRRSRVSSA